MNRTREQYWDNLLIKLTLILSFPFCFGMIIFWKMDYSEINYKKYLADNFIVDCYDIRSSRGRGHRDSYTVIATGRLEKAQISTSIAALSRHMKEDVKKIPVWVRVVNGKKRDLVIRKPKTTSVILLYDFLKPFLGFFSMFILPFIVTIIIHVIRYRNKSYYKRNSLWSSR